MYLSIGNDFYKTSDGASALGLLPYEVGACRVPYISMVIGI